jgi:nucleotide-binding universal stress UspA family protein
MSRLIVVPLDGSGFAESAIATAGRLAAQTGGWLNLVTVHRPGVFPFGSDVGLEAGIAADTEIREAERAYLTQQADQAAAAFGVPVTPVLLEGPVAPTLKQYAESRKADLVVLSTHGRGGVSRFFLGSVADRLIRELHCPMLLVRPGGPEPAVEEDQAIRVAIPLDGSPLAESAIQQVLGVLRPDGAIIELVRVLVPAAAPAPASREERQSLRRHERLLANRYLAGVARRLREQGIRAHAEVVVAKDAAGAIMAFAEGRRCHLVALATRGAGGLERFLLGSVADKVIRGATTPVLVWNPPGQPLRPPQKALAVAAGLTPV